jgi:hypothetical protein
MIGPATGLDASFANDVGADHATTATGRDAPASVKAARRASSAPELSPKTPIGPARAPYSAP